jgi:hypothetical protein
MHPEDIRRRLTKKPFEPFRLCLTDGVAYEIRHPEAVLLGKRFVALGLSDSPDDPLADRLIDVDPLHIIRVEPITAPAPPGGNGQGGGQ